MILGQFAIPDAKEVYAFMAVAAALMGFGWLIWKVDNVFSGRFAKKTEMEMLRHDFEALKSEVATMKTSTVTAVEARTEKIDNKLELILESLGHRKSHG